MNRHHFTCFIHYSVKVHMLHTIFNYIITPQLSLYLLKERCHFKSRKKYTIWCFDSGRVSVSPLSCVPEVTDFSTAPLINEGIWLICDCIFEKSRRLNVHVPQLAIFCALTYLCVPLWRGCNSFQFLQILFRHSFFAPIIVLLLW